MDSIQRRYRSPGCQSRTRAGPGVGRCSPGHRSVNTAVVTPPKTGFAYLDRVLDLPVDTPLAEFVNVLKGAAIARGELVGMFENPDPLLDAPSPARTGSYGRDEGEPRPPTGAEIDAGRGGLDRDDPDRHAPHDPDGVVRPG